MKYLFTEKEYQGAYRFGGKLEIVAEGAKEVEGLISHFRLFRDMSDTSVLKARIAALESETLSHVIESDKRPVYAVSGCLDFDFTAPYKEWAEKDLGYTGVLPDLELPRKNGGLIHTNYQARLYLESEHICFDAFTTAEPWAKKDAQDYAQSLVTDYIGEEFGQRKHESEFIQKGNGQYYRNPDYLKRHRATPMASNGRLKRAIFDWWMATHANDAQKAIVQGNADIVAKTGSYMGAFDFERHQYAIYYEHTGKDYKSVSFAEFAAMGKES